MDWNLTEWMSVVNWSRAQFAMTAIYHWLFVPLTLGLGVTCAIMETIYYKTKNEFWKTTTKFWMRLFGVNFAVGVATGIILEFEFGTNWSNYSHFVGDIFGAPLAIEGIMAFFMEATFLAVMFFGWNKVSKRFHLVSTWMTAIGANLSALWILVANAWMQYPVGMTFNVDTARSEMTSFWEVLFSPVAMAKFAHTVTSGFVLASVFVIGVSAWFLLKKREELMAMKSIGIASIIGLLSSIAVAFTGDISSVQVAKVQPMKLAAIEALYQGKEGAGLSVIAILDDKEGKKFNLEIPKLLSLMSYRDANAYVAGINDIVYGNPQRGLISAQEKMKRGRIAIDELYRFQLAKKKGDSLVIKEIAVKFDPNTPDGKVFLSNYFKYFGYGYLKSPQDIIPNVPLLFYAFRIMVGLGFFFIVLFSVVLYAQRKANFISKKWLLYTMLWSIPLAYLASVTGWVVTEVGRQPWTVQDLLPTVAAVSKNNSVSVIGTFFVFVILFTVLLIAEISIMTKQIKLGSEPDKH